jgi:septal ring factor EnvC (AmiA/AmiB activator)
MVLQVNIAKWTKRINNLKVSESQLVNKIKEHKANNNKLDNHVIQLMNQLEFIKNKIEDHEIILEALKLKSK